MASDHGMGGITTQGLGQNEGLGFGKLEGTASILIMGQGGGRGLPPSGPRLLPIPQPRQTQAHLGRRWDSGGGGSGGGGGTGWGGAAATRWAESRHRADGQTDGQKGLYLRSSVSHDGGQVVGRGE